MGEGEYALVLLLDQRFRTRGSQPRRERVATQCAGSQLLVGVELERTDGAILRCRRQCALLAESAEANSGARGQRGIARCSDDW